MHKGRGFGLLVLLLGLIQSALAEVRFDEGLWEFTVRYDFVGIPQHFPEYVTRQCISHADPIPDISRPGQECNDQLQGRFGHTITWQLNCSTDWEMVHGMGRIHYMGDSALGDVHLQVINPYNPPQPMLFRLNGRHVGPCEN